jgi:hypothetical protein
MRLPVSRNHALTLGLSLACAVFIGGCDKSQDKPAKTAAPAAPATAPAAPAAATPAPAPNGGKISNVPVTGNEPLPPNHPALPAATPPHPGGTAGANASIDQQIASQHPKPAGKTKLAVVIPDSVKGKWSAANIAVATNGAEKEVKVAIGDKISLGNNLQLQIVHYLPAYTSDFQTVTSSSNEQVNPAIMVQAIVNGKIAAEGWVFQKLPEFNSFHSEQAKVRLLSGERAQKK